MDFNLTEYQWYSKLLDFAQKRIVAREAERDEHSKFPTEQVKNGRTWFMGMMVDPKYGGSGLRQCFMF
jgi:alkylation response protein AidB-like acyl-CoA dehydrogenase